MSDVGQWTQAPSEAAWNR